MAIAISGKAQSLPKGKYRITCTGGTSLIEINQDNIGFVPLSGGDVIAGVILAESSFISEELSLCQVRFTGTGTVSYIRLPD